MTLNRREEWDRAGVIRGGFEVCAGCDTATTPAFPAVECHQGDKRAVLHLDCYVMWDEARQ